MSPDTCYGCLWQTWKRRSHANSLGAVAIVCCSKQGTPKDKRERGWVEFGSMDQIADHKLPTPYDDCWVHP